MHADHSGFWLDLAGMPGPANFAATVVGCLLQERVATSHSVLMATGLTFIGVSHWGLHHAGRPAASDRSD